MARKPSTKRAPMRKLITNRHLTDEEVTDLSDLLKGTDDSLASLIDMIFETNEINLEWAKTQIGVYVVQCVSCAWWFGREDLNGYHQCAECEFMGKGHRLKELTEDPDDLAMLYGNPSAE